MPGRPLSPDEAQLWARVMSSVRPLRPAKTVPAETMPPRAVALPRTAVAPVAPPPRKVAGPGVTLDGSWDRRLGSGTITPDSTIDLHGHTLQTAYHALDDGLARAVGCGDRILLLITGKAPRDDASARRGVIRAAVGDWLAASRHASAIAAVRPAHPRHGGAGALYIVLRRPRADHGKF